MIKHPAHSGFKFLEANLFHFPEGYEALPQTLKTHSLRQELHPGEELKHIPTQILVDNRF